MYASLFLSFGIISCNAKQSKSDQVNQQDSGMLGLPKPQELSEAEKNKLHNECDRWFDSILKKSGFNGGILVAKGGNIIYENYKGTANLGATDTITSSTPFHIASVSKTFTAMATLKLAQERRLNIDDEFSKYFPTFNYPGVTIKTLLNHRSGLPNYIHFMEKLWKDKKVHVKNQDVYDYLVNRKSEMENIARPNSRFSYCNTNFALLALLIEKVTDTSYPLYIKTHIFKPLKMENSFVYTPDMANTVPPNYDWRGNKIPMMFLDDTYGDKNIYSTVEDLLKWDRVLATNLIFSKATLDSAFTPYSNEKAGVKNYGLGWRMDLLPNGKKIIFHNGWWHGNNAAFIRLIDQDATIIAVSNRFASTTYKAKQLANIFTHYFDINLDEELEVNAPPVKKKELPPSSPKKTKSTSKKLNR